MTEAQNNLERNERLIDNQNPIAAKDPAYEQIFKDLQGGILKNYGRKYSLYLFIQFDVNKINEVKKWLRDEISNQITSTWQQLQDTEHFKREREKNPDYLGTLCKNFFLSDRGYQTLGLDPDKSNDEGEKLDRLLFKNGMKQDWENNYRLATDREYYWYNPPEKWDLGNDRIDALIILAHSNFEELKDEAEDIIKKSQKFGKVLACEAGYSLKDNDRNSVGPFGFLDGISQPLFLEKDYQDYQENQSLDNWNPFASLNLVLVKDPFGVSYSYGSYCVFQKIETNYSLFQEKIGQLAEVLNSDVERANALIIGRYKDGTALDISDGSDRNLNNDFDYSGDRDGTKCPLQAHIRQVNPRNDDPDNEKPRREKNRIFRAGITYFDDPNAAQKNNSDILQVCLNKLDYLNNEISQKSIEENIKMIGGLLFVCFQSNINVQFSKLQVEWADTRDFPRNDRTYLDPLIGNPANRSRQADPRPQEWPQNWNENNFVRYPFYGSIKNRGGEFFFAPSISFFKKLCSK